MFSVRSSILHGLSRLPANRWQRRAQPLLLLIGAGTLVVGCGLLTDGDADGVDGSTPAASQDANEETAESQDGDTTTQGDASATPAEQRPLVDFDAEFSSGTCSEAIPVSYEPRCGTVEVPMNWETGDGTVTLAVAVFPAATGEDTESNGTESNDAESDGTESDESDDAAAPIGGDTTPVIYLEGGPGGHALEALQFTAPGLLDPLLVTRDVVVFDQRGAGLSEPQLRCTEVTDTARELEDIPVVSDDVADQRFHEALAQCRERLQSDGVELASFNTRFNARDVDAVRQALGYEQVSLLGVSYGTKLGLEVLRQHPDSVRSAVLDSVFPPEVDSVRENPQTFIDAYGKVVQACAAEPGCRTSGDLGERLADMASRLQVEPIQVTVEDWIDGSTDEIYLTGDVLVGLVTQSLYSPQSFADIPELVDDLEAGQLDVAEEYLSQQRTTERFFTDGMFYAITCREEVGFSDPEAVVDPPDPFGLRSEFNLASNVGSNAFATCEAFENGLESASANEAVESDAPTLLLAGEFDPVTPVQWAVEAEEDLANSLLVVAPHDAHGVSSSSCGMSVIAAFLNDPEGSLGADPQQALDTDCLSQRQWAFIDAPAASVELVDASFISQGLEVTTRRPDAWTVGVLEGDQYRRSSFLDPVQLHQLAGDERLGEALGQFIEDSHDVQLGPSEPLGDSLGDASGDSSPLSTDWIIRSATGPGVVVDWFQRPVGELLIYVIMVSTPDERDSLIESVLRPALSSIEISQAG